MVVNKKIIPEDNETLNCIIFNLKKTKKQKNWGVLKLLAGSVFIKINSYLSLRQNPKMSFHLKDGEDRVLPLNVYKVHEGLI